MQHGIPALVVMGVTACGKSTIAEAWRSQHRGGRPASTNRLGVCVKPSHPRWGSFTRPMPWNRLKCQPDFSRDE